LILSVWNPNQLDEMALPPCVLLLQFYVNNGKLSLQIYGRSGDTFLGICHNISVYSLLTILMAKITGLEPHELIWTGGDTHIYSNHFDAVNKQLKREPFDFPKLKINKEIKTLEDIENMCFEDFELVDYKYHPVIKAPMAV
jgi:thymidylate synthase